jgi:hypothetical protein
MIAALLMVALAQPPEALPVERYQWHDADTAVGAIVRLPYGVLLEGSIRAADYDAWELGNRGGQSVDDAERQRGRKAADAIRRPSAQVGLLVRDLRALVRRPVGQCRSRCRVRIASRAG